MYNIRVFIFFIYFCLIIINEKNKKNFTRYNFDIDIEVSSISYNLIMQLLLFNGFINNYLDICGQETNADITIADHLCVTTD